MNAMKTALLGATLLIGASAAANAADVYRRASLKDEPVYTPAIVWTGLYVGLNAGVTTSDTISQTGWADYDADSDYVLGGHIGYNWQTSGNLVLGVEGDFSAVGAEYASSLGSVRGRIGLAMDKSLLYATGGVAFLNWDDNTVLDTSTGLVVGLGYEHKLTRNVSFGVEGLYYSFNDSIGTDDVDRDLFAVRGRLNYHFGASEAGLK